VAEVANRGFAKETFGALGEEVVRAHLLQHGPHMLQVLCPSRAEDQNVIKKYKHEATVI
jgi:hypothetical protein